MRSGGWEWRVGEPEGWSVLSYPSQLRPLRTVCQGALVRPFLPETNMSGGMKREGGKTHIYFREGDHKKEKLYFPNILTNVCLC